MARLRNPLVLVPLGGAVLAAIVIALVAVGGRDQDKSSPTHLEVAATLKAATSTHTQLATATQTPTPTATPIVLLQPTSVPTPKTVTVVVGNNPTMGPADAKVTIVEFSDFQCPYCGRFATQTLGQILSNYGDKIRFVFMNFPLTQIHENAEKAAEAGECANEQGAFWRYHDILFQSQSALTVDSLKGYAAQLGLDTARFNECLDSGKMTDAVQADMQVAQTAAQDTGLTRFGTPTFFINGKSVSGAQPFEVFKQAIDAALADAPTFPVVRKMILVGGIDSASSCSDSGNTFFARREKVKEILQPYLPGLQSWDIYGLSYADQYTYCMREAGPGGPSSSGGTYSLSDAPEWAATPWYATADTCGGVAKASASLGRLIDHILQSEPGAEFDIVAHSMGGLVVSYYVAQQDAAFLGQHIHSVVLLDSPVSQGVPAVSPLSVCPSSDPSWQDMLPGSGVIRSISDSSRTTLRVRFSAVLATPIGQWLPGMSTNNVRTATNYTDGSGGGLVGGVAGFLLCLWQPWTCPLSIIGGDLVGKWWADIGPAHSAVWYDPVTAQAIIEAVTAP